MSDKDKSKALAGAAAAASLGSLAPKNILGYNTLYHGTSHESAEKIRKEGLKRKFAGNAAAGGDIKLGRASMDKIKGKVFTSSDSEYVKNYQPGVFLKDGQNVKMKVPYRGGARRPIDEVVKHMTDRAGSSHEKKMMEHTQKIIHVIKHDIKPRFIEGSADYKGIKQFANKGNIRRYLSQAGGKARFTKGIAQAAGAGIAAGYSANKVRELTKKASEYLR